MNNKKINYLLIPLTLIITIFLIATILYGNKVKTELFEDNKIEIYKMLGINKNGDIEDGEFNKNIIDAYLNGFSEETMIINISKKYGTLFVNEFDNNDPYFYHIIGIDTLKVYATKYNIKDIDKFISENSGKEEYGTDYFYMKDNFPQSFTYASFPILSGCFYNISGEVLKIKKNKSNYELIEHLSQEYVTCKDSVTMTGDYKFIFEKIDNELVLKSVKKVK